MSLSLIVGVTKSNGIGNHNTLPWNFPEDIKNFRIVTKRTQDPNKQNAIIMGRNTMDSIGRLPLGGRINVCISKTVTEHHSKNIIFYDSLDKAVSELRTRSDIENIFIIGGRMLYDEALKRDDCCHLYINRLNTDVGCNVFFPQVDYTLYDIIDTQHISSNVTAIHYIKKQVKDISSL